MKAEKVLISYRSLFNMAGGALILALLLPTAGQAADDVPKVPAVEVGFAAGYADISGWTNTGLAVKLQAQTCQLRENNPAEAYGRLDSPVLTLDIDKYPYLTIKLKNDPAKKSGWTLALNNETPLTVQQYTPESGVVTFDLREKTGWKGTQKFFLSLYVIGKGKSIDVNWIKAASQPLKAYYELTGADANRGYLLVARKPFAVHLPEPSEIDNKMSIFACPNEYEPATFMIYTAKELKNVSVIVNSDLRSGNNKIPKESVDIRILKSWYQATSQSPLGEPGLIPELLLKNNNILFPDYDNKRNILNFKGMPEDSPALLPFNMAAYTYNQIWLTVNVPLAAPPGFYKGAVEVKAEGGAAHSIPLEVEVLPIKLIKPKVNYSIYYHNCIGGGSPVGAIPDSYEAEIKDMAARGFSSVMVQEGVKLITENGQRRVDLTDLKRALDMRVRYGLTAPTTYIGFNWATKEPDALFRKPLDKITPEEKETVTYITSEIVKMLKENPQYPELIFMLCVDEPGYDPTGYQLKLAALNCEVLQKAGARTATAINKDGADKLGALLDVAILDEPSANALYLKAGYQKTNRLEYCYWHPDENPVYDRFRFGLVIWKTKLDGTAPWVYQWSVPRGWLECNAGVAKQQVRTLDYTYAANKGVVPTIQWEAAREGIDDVRYLTTLACLVKESEKSKGNPAIEQERAKSIALLDNLPEAFVNQSLFVLYKSLKPEDFQNYRRQVAEQIMKLQNLLKNQQN